ncbi:MAG: hypothetical protein KAT71_01180 [Gammaproteobacteria bacterium]|nr:hypothetical protein [Gammaproteobacteria bacterium]
MDTPSIALIFPHPLGDSILFLVLGNNLQRNGYKVTYYSNYIAQMQEWFPDVDIKPYPKPNTLSEVASHFDLVIGTPSSLRPYDNPEAAASDLAQRYVIMTYGKHMEHEFKFDHSERIRTKIVDAEVAQKLIHIANISGVCLSRAYGRDFPLAEKFVQLCKKVMQLDNVINDCGITAPSHLIHRKYPRRVIVHPISNEAVRVWPREKFIKLATRLSKDGWEPVFCMAPGERAAWEKELNDRFLLPEFPTINDLASFIYESGFMIGNDFSIGHLSSTLLIPTLTIRWRSNFRSRPCWVLGKIVTPPRIFPKRYRRDCWRKLISVRRVTRAFNSLVREFSSQAA